VDDCGVGQQADGGVMTSETMQALYDIRAEVERLAAFEPNSWTFDNLFKKW